MLRLILFLYQITILILQTGAGVDWEQCTAPKVQNVNLQQFVNITFHIILQTIDVGGPCQNFTLTAADNPPTKGNLTINTENGSSVLPWLWYKDGVIMYKLQDSPDQPENYMAFLYYNGMSSSPQSFAALDCLNNTYYEEKNNVSHRMSQVQPKNLMVGTTLSNPNPVYIDALKKQALAADHGLINCTFVPIYQGSKCFT